MNTLIVPLSSITDKAATVNACVPSETVRPEHAPELPFDEVRVQGSLSDVGGDLLFQGTIVAKGDQACDRCLETGRRTVESEVAWFFERGTEEVLQGEEELFEDGSGVVEDERPRYFSGSEVDLRPHVWEELVLVAPLKHLCSEECRGLCPTCGANLNRAPCSCKPKATEKGGLAALADMFPDLAPETSED